MTKLNVDTGGLDIGNKLWAKHQADEYTHVDNYKEAICINCFKRDATAATIVDICGDCAGKRGREPLLAKITDKMYGLCYFCGEYKFHIEQIKELKEKKSPKVEIQVRNVYSADFKAIDDTIESIKKASRKVSTNDYAANNVYVFLQNCLKKVLDAEK